MRVGVPWNFLELDWNFLESLEAYRYCIWVQACWNRSPPDVEFSGGPNPLWRKDLRLVPERIHVQFDALLRMGGQSVREGDHALVPPVERHAPVGVVVRHLVGVLGQERLALGEGLDEARVLDQDAGPLLQPVEVGLASDLDGEGREVEGVVGGALLRHHAPHYTPRTGLA